MMIIIVKIMIIIITLFPPLLAKGGGSGMGPPASAPHPMLEIPGRSNNALTCDHEDSHWLISVTF